MTTPTYVTKTRKQKAVKDSITSIHNSNNKNTMEFTACPTTTSPAPEYTPRNDDRFSEEESKLIDDTVRRIDWVRATRMVVAAYMVFLEWDEEEVVTKIKALRVEMDSREHPTLGHVLPYIGADPQGVPRPCGLLLEDGRGGCARDVDGNPIVVTYGAFECDSEAAILQMNFLMDRMNRYIYSSEIPAVTYVLDLGPRAKLHNYTTPLNLTFLKYTTLFAQTFKIHICCASSTAQKAIGLLPSGMRSKTTVSGDYSNLAGKISPANMLPSWGGTYNFEIPKYMEFLLHNMNS